jgi:hypothetical protein
MNSTTIFVTALAVLPAFYSPADVLELKDGKVLTGKYVGGSAATIRFETGDGLQVIETTKALALTFTGGGPVAATPAPPPQVAPAPVAPAPAPSSATVPAGTVLLVRMLDGATSRDYRGKRFTTTLETDLIVNGVMLAKGGTRVYGRVANAKQAGRYAGRSFVDLRLSELTVGGVLVPIVTGPYAEAGASSLGKTAKGAATGAAIGAIAGDAGKGAAIGATASGLKRGQTVGVAPGELIEFTLQQPLTVKITS